MITYSNSKEQVLENDKVLYRSMLLWWRWKPGKISYIPGVTKFHKEMEANGLRWIGITGEDGTFRGVLVDPDSNILKNTVRFVERSSEPAKFGPHEMTEKDW